MAEVFGAGAIGTTNDGSTLIFEGKDSNNIQVWKVDTDGNMTVVGGDVLIGTAVNDDGMLQVMIPTAKAPTDDTDYRTAIFGLEQPNMNSLEFRSGRDDGSLAGRYASIQSWSNQESSAQNLLLNPNGGNLLVGTTNDFSSARITVDAANTDGSSYLFMGRNSVNSLRFYVNDLGSTTVGSHVNTEAVYMKVGANRTGNGNAYIDLIGDATYTTYGLRIIRNSGGPNTTTQIQHRGTGIFYIENVDAANLVFKTNSSDRMTITSVGNVGIGLTPSSSHKVSVYNNQTDPSLSWMAMRAVSRMTLTANSARSIYGMYTEAFPDVRSGVSTSGGFYNVYSHMLRNYAYGTDAGSIASIFAYMGTYGHYDNGAVSPTTTNVYGLYLNPYTRSGTITNMYDFYVNTDDGTGATVTNRYGIYINSVGSYPKHNMLKDTLSVGTTNNYGALTVEGVMALDETSAPSAQAGYGKLYVKSSDGNLYFKDSGGTEHQLTT